MHVVSNFFFLQEAEQIVLKQDEKMKRCYLKLS